MHNHDFNHVKLYDTAVVCITQNTSNIKKNKDLISS